MAETVTVVPVELPRPTTADDLLEMYDEIPETSGEAEVTSDPDGLDDILPPREEPAKPTEEVAPEPENKIEVAPSPEYPTLKAKLGDKDIEVPADATFSGQINGKTVTIKAKDAVDFYLNQETIIRNNDRRTTQLTQREAAYKKEMDNVKEKTAEMISAAQAGDYFKGMMALAKLASDGSSFNQVAIERSLFKNLDQVYKAFSNLKPEQQEKFFSDREAKLLKEELKARDMRDASQKEASNMETQVESACESAGVTKDVFWETFDSIAKNIVGEGKQFKRVEDIGIKDVVHQIQLNRQWGIAYKAAEAAGLQREEVIDEIARLAGLNPELEVEHFVKMIKDAGLVPQESVENLNRKTAKSNGAVSNKGSSTKKEELNGYDQEDIDFLERHRPRAYKPIVYR